MWIQIIFLISLWTISQQRKERFKMKERRKEYVVNRSAELQVKSFISEMIYLGRNKSEIKDALIYFVDKHYDDYYEKER